MAQIIVRGDIAKIRIIAFQSIFFDHRIELDLGFFIKQIIREENLVDVELAGPGIIEVNC